ncbi:hypothetical protein [Actinomadura luteofluorescens]|uniref:hypothetical protein n=1 Tax=Actinomadura luteofluorescens TaxID=46163 RepID=UPI002164C8F7|nr:hypothetical protein [Actinomadura glauciflava]
MLMDVPETHAGLVEMIDSTRPGRGLVVLAAELVEKSPEAPEQETRWRIDVAGIFPERPCSPARSAPS